MACEDEPRPAGRPATRTAAQLTCGATPLCVPTFAFFLHPVAESCFSHKASTKLYFVLDITLPSVQECNPRNGDRNPGGARSSFVSGCQSAVIWFCQLTSYLQLRGSKNNSNHLLPSELRRDESRADRALFT